MTKYEELLNDIIDWINGLIRAYTIPGILVVLIAFGLFLLLLTYLPYIVGLLVVVLVGYLVYLKFR